MSITKVLDSLHKIAVEETQKPNHCSRQYTINTKTGDWKTTKRYGSVSKEVNVKKHVEYCKKMVSLIGESTKTFEKDLQELEKQYKNKLHNVACKRDIKLACEKYLSSCRMATSEYNLDPSSQDASKRPRTVDQQCMAKFRKATTYNTFTNTDLLEFRSDIALNVPKSDLCNNSTRTQKATPTSSKANDINKKKNSSKNSPCNKGKKAGSACSSVASVTGSKGTEENKELNKVKTKCKIPISVKPSTCKKSSKPSSKTSTNCNASQSSSNCKDKRSTTNELNVKLNETRK